MTKNICTPCDCLSGSQTKQKPPLQIGKGGSSFAQGLPPSPMSFGGLVGGHACVDCVEGIPLTGQNLTQNRVVKQGVLDSKFKRKAISGSRFQISTLIMLSLKICDFPCEPCAPARDSSYRSCDNRDRFAWDLASDDKHASTTGFRITISSCPE